MKIKQSYFSIYDSVAKVYKPMFNADNNLVVLRDIQKMVFDKKFENYKDMILVHVLDFVYDDDENLSDFEIIKQDAVYRLVDYVKEEKGV